MPAGASGRAPRGLRAGQAWTRRPASHPTLSLRPASLPSSRPCLSGERSALQQSSRDRCSLRGRAWTGAPAALRTAGRLSQARPGRVGGRHQIKDSSRAQGEDFAQTLRKSLPSPGVASWLTPCASRLGGDLRLETRSSLFAPLYLGILRPTEAPLLNPPQAPSPALFRHGLNSEVSALPFCVRSAPGSKRPESLRRGKGRHGRCCPLSAI